MTTTRSTIPTVQPRLAIDPLGNFLEKHSREGVLSSVGTAVGPDLVPEYDSSAEIACPQCSHDGCVHYHSSQRRIERRAAQGFLRYRENTLFTKHSRGEMPNAISGPPLEFDTCHLAAFKYDGVILTSAQYDRTAHLAAIPAAHDERVRRQREKSEKLSAHMRRRHAAARVAHRRSAKKGGAK